MSVRGALRAWGLSRGAGLAPALEGCPASLLALWRARAPAWGPAFHAGAPAAAASEIKVQSMGESISEGTVAALLKREGERVEQDEPILQIETDKVTVDVRAPEGGVLTSLLVKEEDTVVTGQLVAVVDPAAQPGAAPAQAQSRPAAEAAPAPSASSSPQEGADPPGAALPKRQASIRFPPRVTQDGRRISALPAQEQDALAERHAAPASPPESPAAAPDESPRGSIAVDGGVTTSLRRALESRLGGSSNHGWYAGKERGSKLSQSQVLSEREMEIIQLGGAFP